jgi:hypothetical protein
VQEWANKIPFNNTTMWDKFKELLARVFDALAINSISLVHVNKDSLLEQFLSETLFLQDALKGKETKVAVTNEVKPTQSSTSVKPIVEIEANYYTSELLKANPDKIYVFGDNNQRQGKKGQASVRDEANAMGISTKLRPSADADAFMTDNQIKANVAIIDSDIAKIKATGKTIVFPKDGLGTGLAALKSKAPNTYEYLVIRLKEEFGFDNNTGTLVVSLTEAFSKSTQPATSVKPKPAKPVNTQQTLMLDFNTPVKEEVKAVKEEDKPAEVVLRSSPSLMMLEMKLKMLIENNAPIEKIQNLQNQIANFTEVQESPLDKYKPSQRPVDKAAQKAKPILDEDILSSEKFINFVEEQNSQQMFPLPTKLLLEHFKKCR